MIEITYTPQYGYAFLEAFFAFIALFVIFHIVIKRFFRQDLFFQQKYRNGSAVICLIVFGIIFVIRTVFEYFGRWFGIFRMLNNDQLLFAIMVSLYFFLYKPIVERLSGQQLKTEIQSQKFKKFFNYFLVVVWVISIPFLSISFLQIKMERNDIFNIGLLWAIYVVFLCIFFSSIINRSLTVEKKMAKILLRKAQYVGGLTAFGFWAIQLVIFELYLNRWLKLEIIKQDIRVLIVVVSSLFIIFFLQSLKTKFLPEIKEKSRHGIQKLMDTELKNQSGVGLENEEEILDTQHKVKEIRFPEGISYKAYLFVSKKFRKSSPREAPLKSRNTYILGGLSWIITIGVFITLLFYTLGTSNIFINILFLSATCSLFMVLGDFLIIVVFNRFNPSGTRTPTRLLIKTVLIGGSLTFWIWSVLSFTFFSYLFIFISDKIVVDLVYITIFSIFMFIAATRIIWWYATSIRMWNVGFKNPLNFKKKASRVSFIFLVINIPLRIIINSFILPYSNIFDKFFGERWDSQFMLLFFLIELPITVINIVFGIFIIVKVYKKRFIESLTFSIILQIFFLLISVATHIIMGFISSLTATYTFNLFDLRIPLVVATGIYIISIASFKKVKSLTDASEKIKEKNHYMIQSHEEHPGETFKTDHNVLLDVKDLKTYFYTEEGIVRAVEGVSFKIYKGETLGLVGETGCGKSVTALSILRLVRPPGEIKSGQVIFEGEDLHQKSEGEFLSYRGSKITMIFQDPLNSLNPVYKIGDQISEVYLLHMQNELLIESVKNSVSIYAIAREWSQQLLKDLNISESKLIFDRYPHELSGGMRQRVQIAMGLACSPRLLIADEPTTALDVTIQNQILKLMKELKVKYNTSILFITHDLGIISKMCNRVAVMYSGFIVEYGEKKTLFQTPYHPYTRGLIASAPVVGKKRRRLDVIAGVVPNLIYPPSGCRFHPRCQYCFEPCDSVIPRSVEIEPRYLVACHLYDPEYKDLAKISMKKVELE